MAHIILILILSLFAAPVYADHEAGHCIVTSSSGNVDNPGSFIRRLANSNCKKITFEVDHVDPLMSLIEINEGVTIEGKSGIELRYIQEGAPVIVNGLPQIFHWENQTYKECLLRILPRGNGVGGVILSNLTIINPDGEGICVRPNGNRGPINGNKISNIVIRAKTGINLGTSNSNLVERATITGENGGVVGITLQGSVNKVDRGTIKNFSKGIEVNEVNEVNNDGVRNTFRQVNFEKISGEAIRNLQAVVYRPNDLWPAFVTAGGNQYALAGRVHKAVHTVDVYIVTASTGGAGKDYKFKKSLSITRFISSDSQSRLGADERRFVVTLNRGEIDPAANLVFLSTASEILDVTSPFSPESAYHATTPLVGGMTCAGEEWFWHSFDDRRSNPNSAYRGWDVDYDADGLANSCTAASCTNSRVAEDLNRDCQLQVNESAPNREVSQYDADRDGVPDHFIAGGQRVDNCVWRGEVDRSTFNNPGQQDTDGDGIGDACEGDIDNDGFVDGLDNCRSISNRDQRDSDGDGIGDACQSLRATDIRCLASRSHPEEADCDGVLNVVDNCPYHSNANQKDTDGDSAGDVCDTDDDNDGLADAEETVAGTNPLNPDNDGDRICDGPGWGFGGSCIRPLDNCPKVLNAEQTDRDEDTIGDACDAAPAQWLGGSDSDKKREVLPDGTVQETVDGISDETDNCAAIFNPSQSDNDTDGVGDACDSDDDNDGLDDATESGMFNPYYRGSINAHRYLNADLDRDQIPDGVDDCPNYSATGSANATCGGYSVNDIDNDTKTGANDNCPKVSNKDQRDTDRDRQGDACDLDDDNDSGDEADCRDYLRGGMPIVARNGANCVAAVCNRTCDFDESANARLFPWDPNSDHKNGEILQPADALCDGAGTGFDREGSLTKCGPSDLCPEYYNGPGTENAVCGPGLSAPAPAPEEAPIPPAAPQPAPTPGPFPSTNVQGSGCSMNGKSMSDTLLFFMLLANIILLAIVRRSKFSK